MMSLLLLFLLQFSGVGSFTTPSVVSLSNKNKKGYMGLAVGVNGQASLQATMMPSLLDDASSSSLLLSSQTFGSVYEYCLQQHYYPTQSITGAIFSSIGDTIAQLKGKYSDKEDGISLSPIDTRRTCHYFLKGLGGGVMWGAWFEMADVWALSLTHSVLEGFNLVDGDSSPLSVTTFTRTIISILMEQFLVCPVFYSLWDIPLPALLRGQPVSKIPSQIQAKLGPLLVANAKVWTLVNLITYGVVPLEYRVLFTSSADILWQSINAGITSQDERTTLSLEEMARTNMESLVSYDPAEMMTAKEVSKTTGPTVASAVEIASENTRSTTAK